jgi:hypothetical protein
MYVCCWAMHSFFGSVARQRPIGNNGLLFSLGSILRARWHRNIFLLIIIIHHLLLGRGGVFLLVRSEDLLPREHLSPNNNQIQNTGGSSLGVKRSGCEAVIQPELQKGEFVRSRHAWMKQLKTEIEWKINVKWSTLHSYHSCVHGVLTGWPARFGFLARARCFSSPVTTGGVKTLANYNYFYVMP